MTLLGVKLYIFLTLTAMIYYNCPIPNTSFNHLEPPGWVTLGTVRYEPMKAVIAPIEFA